MTITIDLGRAVWVGQVTWHTAAGASGVEWPAAIYVYASTDGVRFAALGDLVSRDAARNGPPPTGKYAEHTFVADFTPAAARYVRLMADPQDPYLFVDEIQVFEASAHSSSTPAPEVTDTAADFWRARPGLKAGTAIRNDLMRVRTRIEMLGLPPDDRSRAEARASAAADAGTNDARVTTSLRSALPLSESHAGLFAALGAAEAAAGQPAIQAWPANPWSPLLPEEPLHGAVPAHVDVVAMRGERRSGAFNIRNNTDQPATLDLSASLDGVPTKNIHLAPIAWTGTEQGGWVAAKILPQSSSISVPAGTTTQIWMTLDSGDTGPGLHTGTASLRAGGRTVAEVPLAYRVFSTRFPAQPSLLISGWDYLSGPGAGGITATNIEATAGYLQSEGINVAWATRAVLDFGGFDSGGHLATPPSTTSLEHWLARTHSAKRYRVFLSAKGDIGGIIVNDPRFAGAVKEWASFWAAAIQRLGRSPADFDLHLVDEPRTDAQAQLAIAWMRAVKGSGVGFRLWTNPNWPDPNQTPAEILRLADVICINLHIADAAGSAYWDWARRLASSGKALELYGTDGPAKLLDPYAYYRATAWRASDLGAQGIAFWSFSDTGGGESSYDFAARAIDYVPFFLDRNGVAPGKHMEAIVEGAQDFEYLRLLLLVARNAPNPSVRSQAQTLLTDARAAVLASASGFYGPWTRGRDRSVADAWRFKIGTLLDSVDLANPPFTASH